MAVTLWLSAISPCSDGGGGGGGGVTPLQEVRVKRIMIIKNKLGNNFFKLFISFSLSFWNNYEEGSVFTEIINIFIFSKSSSNSCFYYKISYYFSK
jgi:hypothetical protein